MITQADFHNLTLDLQDIFNEGAAESVSENVGMSLFSVTDTNRRSFIHQVLHGVAGITQVTPGQDLPVINTGQGDQVTWNQLYFGAIAAVTKDMRKFDLYDQIEGIVKTLVDDAFSKIDQSMADVLTQGYNTSYTNVYGKSESALTPDGLAVFSASHSNPITSRTMSNIISDGTTTNPTLSRLAIVRMRATGLTRKDVNGIVRPINFDTLIVSPENEDLANRIVFSEQMNGTSNNDINPLKGKIKNILVWPRLSVSGDGTDKSAFWFLADSKIVKESLQAKFAERPSLDPPDQAYKNKNWDYSCDFYYTIGRGYPAGIAASNGTGS